MRKMNETFVWHVAGPISWKGVAGGRGPGLEAGRPDLRWLQPPGPWFSSESLAGVQTAEADGGFVQSWMFLGAAPPDPRWKRRGIKMKGAGEKQRPRTAKEQQLVSMQHCVLLPHSVSFVRVVVTYLHLVAIL